VLIEQAAAHGLPIVATKNGGPVDIHRVSSPFVLFTSNVLLLEIPSHIKADFIKISFQFSIHTGFYSGP